MAISIRRASSADAAGIAAVPVGSWRDDELSAGQFGLEDPKMRYRKDLHA